MKKILMVLLGSAVILSACNNEADKQKDTSKNADTKSVHTTTEVDGFSLKEPQADTKCASCNMKVYQKSDDLGKFSAQAIDEEGKNYFFDDLYCLLNYERKSKIKLKEKFVRDYTTLEWVNVKDAKFVNGKIKTPMNVGYASFKAIEDAEKFAHAQHSHVDELQEVDKKALERLMKKQQMQDKNSKTKDHAEQNKHSHS